MALQYISGKAIIYDSAEQDPGNSVYGGDYKTTYTIYTCGTQNSANGGNWDTPYSGAYLARVTNVSRAGGAAYKAYLSMNDKRLENLSYCRAELGWMAPSQQNAANEWNYASISTMVDPSTQLPNNIKYQIAYDHKESPDNRQTPFWLGIWNGNYIIAGLHVGNPISLGPVVKGVWEDWILHRNWDQNGFMKFYRNGELVWQRTGDVRVNSYIARLQHGIYKWAWNKTDWAGEGTPNAADYAPITIYMDEIRFGMKGGTATLADFIIGGTPPPPTSTTTTTQSPTMPPPVFTTPISDVSTAASSATIKVFAQAAGGGWISYFTATQNSGPSNASIFQFDQVGWQPTETNFTFSNLVAGNYTFTVTAHDNTGLTVSDSFNVVVAGAPPTTTTSTSTSTSTSTTTTSTTTTTTLPPVIRIDKVETDIVGGNLVVIIKYLDGTSDTIDKK